MARPKEHVVRIHNIVTPRKIILLPHEHRRYTQQIVEERNIFDLHLEIIGGEGSFKFTLLHIEGVLVRLQIN
jgi:hypothetical protein